MDIQSRQIRIPENGQRIVEENIRILYHFPRKYKVSKEMLDPVRDDLLAILNYVKGIKPIIFNQKYNWYLDTERIKKITGICTRMTASRHFNYLCAMGFLHKQPQTEGNMIGVNAEFMIETGSRRPINVISIYRYTKEELSRIEARSMILLAGKITQGNISKDRLVAAGLEGLAKEVYPANSKRSFDRKKIQCSRMIQEIEKQIKEAGYTTIARLSLALMRPQKEVRKIYSVFQTQLNEQYRYKAPTNEEKQRYNLDGNSWIIVRRNEK